MGERIGTRWDRLRLGEWVIGVAALALLVDLLAVPWYSLRAQFVQTSGEFGAATSSTGFEAHHIAGPLLIIAALFALATWAAQLTSRAPSLPVVLTVATGLAMLVMGIVLIIRVVFDPPAVLVTGPPGVNTIRTDVGAVLGLVLTWVVAVGAWISLRTDGIAPGDAPRQIETLRLTQRSA